MLRSFRIMFCRNVIGSLSLALGCHSWGLISLNCSQSGIYSFCASTCGTKLHHGFGFCGGWFYQKGSLFGGLNSVPVSNFQTVDYFAGRLSVAIYFVANPAYALEESQKTSCLLSLARWFSFLRIKLGLSYWERTQCSVIP